MKYVTLLVCGFTHEYHQNGSPTYQVHQIFVFTVSLRPFNRFSSNFHQKSRNIFSTYRNLLQLQYGRKQNGVQNGVHLDTCVYCISSTVQPIFIKFAPKNLEIYFPTYRNLLEFQYGRKQNGVQNGIHLDICVYCISSTVQPIFIKFSPKISKYISNLEESVIISIWQKTKWRPKWRPSRYL